MSHRLHPLKLVAPVALAALAAACGNPTIDPSSTFTVNGQALNADGAPLANAEVRVVRFYDRLKLLQPTVDDLFECQTADCAAARGYAELGLELGVVGRLRTAADGRFELKLTGAQIQAAGGITDAQGKVEGSNLVVVVVDPVDPKARAGVFSFDNTFTDTDPVWTVADLKLWKSDATADLASAATSGLVRLSWNKLPRRAGSTINNIYRVELGGDADRLVARCVEGVGTPGQAIVEGGCDEVGGKLTFAISAYSLYSFYSTRGAFTAYVTGDGSASRFRSGFVVPMTLPDPSARRDKVGFAGLWAVGDTFEQSLLATAAVDGNASTRVTISGRATAIYGKFQQLVAVTDAGLLNSIVKDAAGTCVSVEFTTNNATDLAAAKLLPPGEWMTAGRFCGATGSPVEMAAVLGFDTSASDGRVGAWIRYRLFDDANVASIANPEIREIGEVAVFKKR
jgi:hypothetical protein